MSLARFVRERSASSISEKSIDPLPQLTVGRRLPFGELLHVAEIQTWVGEGEARHGLIEIEHECITVVITRLYLHAQSAKCLQVPVKPADVDSQLAQYLLPSERPVSEKHQQSKQASRALTGE
jgi:hypothetical protein